MTPGSHKGSALVCTLALALAVSIPLLSGCVYSDMITEVIYNNAESSEVDPDLTPILINSATANETNESLPKLDESDTDSANTTEDVVPFFTTQAEKANTEDPAPLPVYAKEAGPAGEVATKAKPEVEAEQQQESEQTEEEAEQGAEQVENEKGQESADVEQNSDTPSEADSEDDPDDDGQGEGGGPDDPDTPTEPTEPEPASEPDPSDSPDAPGPVGGTGTVYTGDADREPEIPEGISRIAAVGNYAVIASIVSGSTESTALVACDESTKAKTSSVLAARGMPLVLPLWSGDGGEAISAEGFEQLVTDAQPHLVFAEEGSNLFTEEQLAALQENLIDVYYLPKLTSAKRIRFAVRVIGMVLTKGGVAGAEAAYTKYLDFEDRLVAKYTDSDHNGGITGGYNFDTEKNAAAAPVGMATLYIDKWDIDARHESSLVDTTGGVAVATLGYRSSPLSYYMSVGGAVNNAASQTFRYLTGSGVVWQFAQNELGYRFGSWSNLDIATYDLCSKVTGGVYVSDLLWNTNEVGSGYGSDSFPAVVVKNQGLKDRIVANSRSDKQLYFPYPLIHPAGGNGTTIGFFKDASGDGAYVESCIGRAGGGANLTAAKKENCQVLVNPKGLCQQDSDDPLCSWTEGSPESMLEASWVYWRFRGGSEAAFRQDVIDFYNTFYGYDALDALDAVIAGSAS